MATLYCPACGYNLTGLPENRCPECGRAFDPASLEIEATKVPPIQLRELILRLLIPTLFLLTLGGYFVFITNGAGAVFVLPFFLIWSIVNSRELAARLAVNHWRSAESRPSPAEERRFKYWVSAGLLLLQLLLPAGGCAAVAAIITWGPW